MGAFSEIIIIIIKSKAPRLNSKLRNSRRPFNYLRTLARKFSNIDFFPKILPLKDDELVMSEM